MWIAGLAAVVMVAMVLLLAGSPNVTANTQQAGSATTEVKIDNFSFGPGTLTVRCGNDSYLDQPRRYSPYGCQHG